MPRGSGGDPFARLADLEEIFGSRDQIEQGGGVEVDAVVDYGAGNLVSIEQALTSVGATVTVARDDEGLRDVDAVV